MTGMRHVLAAGAALLLGACAAQGGLRDARAPAAFLAAHGAAPPQGSAVTVCSGYGCAFTTKVTFTNRDLETLAAIMAKGGEGPVAERAAIREAVAWLETRVGAQTGLSADRDHRDTMSGGDRTQADCIDEAANTTGYLLLLKEHGLLAHHQVRHPTSKGLLIDGVYPHTTALIMERQTHTLWAVDSWIYANGEPPIVVPEAVWRRTDTQELMVRHGHRVTE